MFDIAMYYMYKQTVFLSGGDHSETTSLPEAFHSFSQLENIRATAKSTTYNLKL